jgi:hypothetical protein
MTRYARGSKAFGQCDRCGLRYPLSKLYEQYIDQFRSNLLVCRQDLDIDHEQLQTENVKTDDPIGLKDPRPDLTQAESREFFGYNPVAALLVRSAIGTTTVSVT